MKSISKNQNAFAIQISSLVLTLSLAPLAALAQTASPGEFRALQIARIATSDLVRKTLQAAAPASMGVIDSVSIAPVQGDWHSTRYLVRAGSCSVAFEYGIGKPDPTHGDDGWFVTPSEGAKCQ